MRKISIIALLWVLGVSAALAQSPFPQTLPANTVVGRLGAGQAGPAQAIPFANFAAAINPYLTGIAPFGSSGQLLIGQPGNAAPLWLTVSGDIASISDTGAVSIAKSGNTSTFATTSGSIPTGHCITTDSHGNLVDQGAACISSSAGVNSGSQYNIGYYATAGSVVSGTGTISSIQNNLIDVTSPQYGFSTSNTASQNATALTNALSALDALGGGTIWIPAATSAYPVACFTIPQSGGSASTEGKQHPFRITGAAANQGGGIGLPIPAEAGGPQLDLRCNTNARITTLGLGTLEIDHLNLINGNTGGGDTVPFILATNTSLIVHDNIISGDTSLVGSANIQDAIQLGNDSTGTNPCNTATCRWEGYYTWIYHNTFDHVQRVLDMVPSNHTVISAVWFYDNLIGYRPGSSSFGAIYCGGGGTSGCASNTFTGNFYDSFSASAYPYVFDFESGAGNSVSNVFLNNTFADDAPATAYYHFNTNITKNFIQCSTCTGTTPVTYTSGGGTWPTSQNNSYFDPTGQTSSYFFQQSGSKFGISGPLFVGGAGIPSSGSGKGAINLYEFDGITFLGTNTPAGSCAINITADAFITGFTFNSCAYGSFVGLTVGQLNYMFQVEAKTSNYTVVGGGGGTNQADNGSVFTNTGSSGEVDFQLPAGAAGIVGETHTFYVTAAHTLKIIPGTSGTLQFNTTAGTTSATCATVGCSVTLVYLGGNIWGATSIVGTWSVS